MESIIDNNTLFCRICNSKNLYALDVGSLFFSPVSYAPKFHNYENFVCGSCGVVSSQPEPNEIDLITYYNNAYRQSDLAFKIENKTIDTLINFRSSGRSFQRAKNFYNMLKNTKNLNHHIEITKKDTIIDFGAYQGMFLSAVSQIWGCKCVATDYSLSGIDFAKTTLGFTDSWVTRDIYKDKFKEKVRIASMVHVLEHLREPRRFLEHLRTNILKKNGILYIEVPNLYGIPLCDPTHFFTYSYSSLEYLLNISGFKVLNISTGIEPTDETFFARSKEENLMCIAISDKVLQSHNIKNFNFILFRKMLTKSYLKHSKNALIRYIVETKKHVFRCLIYFLFIFVIEIFSTKLSLKLAKYIGIRK